MTGVTHRPALFSALGGQFTDAFGNADAVFTVDGAASDPVRVIYRQFRETDVMEFSPQVSLEGVTHRLSVAASALPAGFDRDRDTIAVGDIVHTINTMEDDGRAMVKFLLRSP